MLQYVIIGARGFGRENYSGISITPGYNKDYVVKGFLDDKADALDGFDGYPPILSSVEDYEPQEDDRFICALGDAAARDKYIAIIQAKGGVFPPMISPWAIVSPTAQIGQGVAIAPWSNISANTVIGDFTVVQSFCNIGHDVVIGRNCSLESYTFFGGFASAGDGATLHTRATILPHIKVGDRAIVGAGSVVIKDVPAGETVFGVPARRLK